MKKDFVQIEWNADLEDDLRQLVRLAIREDLGAFCDLTTVSLVPKEAVGAAKINSRDSGVVCGIKAVPIIFAEMECASEYDPYVTDGAKVDRGTTIGLITGRVTELLVAERMILNFLGHLSGISTLTATFAAQILDLPAKIYDTRKTTPGYRRLEKYATRCGGARNHRLGLDSAVLIKDNHLAFGSKEERFTPLKAVKQTQKFVSTSLPENAREGVLIEVEVDSLDQLKQVLPASPDIVLLDNMSIHQLETAVRLRDEFSPEVSLEASGGVTLKSVRAIALSGVDRISVGAITHSSKNLDIGLDWEPLPNSRQ